MKKLIAMTGLVLAAVACDRAVGPAAGTSGPAATHDPASSSPQASAPAPGADPPATTEVSIYYLVSGSDRLYLAPERHRVPATRAIARAALEELVHGTPQDPDHSTPFPRNARIRSVTIRDSVATVDWSAEVLEANAGAEAERLGIESIVYTLTRFPSISSVRFTVEGKDHGTASNGRPIEDWWGHAGLEGQPFTPAPAFEVLEPVTLWTPLEGGMVHRTLTLTGEASTFEANVGIVIRDASGREIVRTSTTATEGAPGRGRFSTTIALPAMTPQVLRVMVIEDSAKDGSVVFQEDRHVNVS